MPAGYAEVVSNVGALSEHSARFSVRYCVASTLLDGIIDYSSFEPGRIGRQSVMTVMNKISLDPYVVDNLEDLSPHAPDRLRVRLRDGTELMHESRTVPGSPDQPLSDSELAEKSMSCLESVLNVDKIQHLIGLVLEDGVKVREVTGLIRQFRTG